MKIKEFNQEDAGFWQLMGRHFASPVIRRELGVAMSSDESYVWLLAMDGDSLVGFCAIAPQTNKASIRHLYVFPASRGKKIGTRLVSYAAKIPTKTAKVATVSQQCLGIWARCGFQESGKVRGQYVEVSHV